MYTYRQLSPAEREALLARRRQNGLPLHAPAHPDGPGVYLLTAANYLHRPVMHAETRRLEFEGKLLNVLAALPGCTVYAWSVLPSHYHVLAYLDLATGRRPLGRLHSGTSTQWNREDSAVGRQVWYRFSDRAMRSERHFWATVNYVHLNAVKHGYVMTPEEWPTSSYPAFLAREGTKRVQELHQAYPIDRYGMAWDL